MKRWMINSIIALNGVLLLLGIFIVMGRLTDTQAEVSALTAELNTTKAAITQEENQLDSIQAELASQKQNNKVLQAVPRYQLHDPTYTEVMELIRTDRTDQNKWIQNVYDCKYFSYDLKKSAEEKGLRCAFVNIVFPDRSGHCLNAFETTDRGLIFIEPQEDREVRVERGNKYSTQLGWRVDIDDTIVDTMIIW
jgi:hypothetical protein